MRGSRLALGLCVLLVALSLLSRGAPAFAQGDTLERKLRVVTTFSILGDVVQSVGKNLVDLRVLIGPDRDTHDYEPVPGDARALVDASLVFENGLGFEPWLDNLFRASRSSARRVVTTTGIQVFRLAERGSNAETDPHVWGDVRNVMTMAHVIRDALSEADPGNAAAYAASADAYVAQLQELDDWIVRQVATIPPERRQLVTNHDALGYFARRYGFQVIGTLMGTFSADAAPSPRHMAALIDLTRSSGVRAIFVENVANRGLMDRVAGLAGVTVVSSLYTDALGGLDSPAASYVGLMQSNVRTIVDALSAP